MAKQRIVYLDVIRVLSCCMIVLMHSPHPDAGIPGSVQAPLYFLTSAGIGLFFMVSGALLLPIKMETGVFLKRRIGKIVGPLLFWTFFYVGVNLLMGETTVEELPRILLSIPFSAQGHGVLWFMYTLCGLYLLAPVLSAFLEKASRQELRFYLGVWMIALCYPLLALYINVNRTATGILYYFTGYAGYFILGYYLHTYPQKFCSLVKTIMMILPLSIVFVLRYYSLDGESPDDTGYLSILVLPMCVAWYNYIQHAIRVVRFVEGKLLTHFSNACFGIYLSHIFVMRYMLWHCDAIVFNFGGIGQIIITWLLSLIISFLLSYLVGYLPFANYIIGYKHK